MTESAKSLIRRDASEPCPVTRAGCAYGTDCAGLGYCKRRVAPRETTQDLRTHIGGGLFVKPLGHIPPDERGGET